VKNSAVLIVCGSAGCVILSVTVREEQRLTVFENRVLGKVFVSKLEKKTGEWRKPLTV
jgi:hypothetical protein